MPRAAGAPARHLYGKCCGISQVLPRIFSHSRPSRSEAVGSPFSLQLGLGGPTPVWKDRVRMVDARCGSGGQVICKKPFVPKPPGGNQRSRVSSQHAPGLRHRSAQKAQCQGGGTEAGRPGPAVLHEEASGGLVSDRAGGERLVLRHRTPPAW